MESGNGSAEVTRLAAAYLTSIVFGVSFLAGSLFGVDGMTALWRSVVAAGCALVAAQFLAPPVVEVVLTAMARDEAKRRAEGDKEDDA
ncbi:MAG: hypothetical protein R3F29_02395 [Planctomycetota bacterium]